LPSVPGRRPDESVLLSSKGRLICNEERETKRVK
jgi:hypothetical protein